VSTRTSGDDLEGSAYRIVVAKNAELLCADFPDAIEAAPGEFEIRAVPLEALNRRLAKLMANGLVVSSVNPAHSALERQFREAVRGDE
jgi:hypothetical protein